MGLALVKTPIEEELVMKGPIDMMFCSICMFLPQRIKKVKHAVTIINGQAVCADHIKFADDTSVNHAVAALEARKEEDARERRIAELAAALPPPKDEVPPR